MTPREKIMDVRSAPRFLTVSAAAGYLNMSRGTVTKAIKSGQIATVKIGDRLYVLRDEMIKAFGL